MVALLFEMGWPFAFPAVEQQRSTEASVKSVGANLGCGMPQIQASIRAAGYGGRAHRGNPYLCNAPVFLLAILRCPVIEPGTAARHSAAGHTGPACLGCERDHKVSGWGVCGEEAGRDLLGATVESA